MVMPPQNNNHRNETNRGNQEPHIFQQEADRFVQDNPEWFTRHQNIADFLFRNALDSRLERNGISGLQQANEIIQFISRHTGARSTYPNEAPYEMSDAVITAVLCNQSAFLPRPDEEQNQSNKKSKKSYPAVLRDSMSKGFIGDYASLIAETDDTSEFVAALSYNLSTKEFERKGAEWRTTVLETCLNEYRDPEDPVENHFMGIVLAQEDRNLGLDLGGVKDQMHNILTEPTRNVPEVLMHYSAPLQDFEKSIEAVSDLDIEGLLIKAARAIYDIKDANRNENVMAGNWCNAQELKSYYGPMLEMAGFKKMAEACYGAANRFLYKDTRMADGTSLIEYAENIHNQAAYTLGEMIDAGLDDAFEDLGYTLKGYRVKSTGSIAEKIDRKGEGVPDAIGIMLCSNDSFIDENKQPSTQAILNSLFGQNGLIKAIEGRFGSLGTKVGNINPGQPMVEIKGFGVSMKDYGIVQKYSVSVEPPTIDSYEGIHVSLIINGTPVEIQIHDPRTEILMEEEASHVFYNMAKNGTGDLPNLRKKMINSNPRNFENAKRDYNEKKQHLLEMIKKQIYPRVAQLGYYMEKAKVNPVVLEKYLISERLRDFIEEIIHTRLDEQDAGYTEP